MVSDDESSFEEYQDEPLYEYDAPGLLTETQRLYLLGESDVESGTQHERTIRSRIRERVANIFQDIFILSVGLEDRDIEQTSEQIAKDKTVNWDPYTRVGQNIGFLLRIYEDISMYYESESIDTSKFEDRMELIMSGAIQYALQKEGYHAGLSCEINVDVESVNELDENIDSLNESELFSLYISEKITHEEYIEQLNNRNE